MGQITLPTTTAGVAVARSVVSAFCFQQRLHPEVAEDAVLLVSELVTNAYVHARAAPVLQVDRAGRVLRVAVEDDDHHLPVIEQVGEEALGGRGLAILHALASRWGAQPTRSGKTVWFELAL